jgi:hypothetical protein
MYATQFAIRIRNLENNLRLITNYSANTSEVVSIFQDFFTKLHISTPINYDLTRIGSKGDGGYLLVNNFSENNIVISFGIGQNVDAELFFATQKINVIMFDGTISKIPKNHKYFTFIPKNIFGGGTYRMETQIDQIEINKVFKEIIPSLIDSDIRFKTVTNDVKYILLIDIEGHEYESLLFLDTIYLERCDQIVVEFHDIYTELTASNSNLKKCLDKLNKTHQVVAVHGNNYGGSIHIRGNDYPDVVEISWLNRNFYEFSGGINTFNHPLSSPNNIKLDDLRNSW